MSQSPARVLLLGATGYTGRLTALAMAKAGLRPVLVGRSRERLDPLLADILANGAVAGGVETADVTDPASLARLIEPGDVVVTTIGPFATLGEPAVTAAIEGGAAAYVDSTGESQFIRRVFEEWGPRAEASGTALLTAFGYDYVPGNLAAAFACRDAMESGAPPVKVDVGYFTRGAAAISGGTAASATGALLAPSYQYAGAQLRTARSGAQWRTFEIENRGWDGLSVGGTEQFAVPRLSPTITEVGVYLGWAGSRTRVASRASGALALAARIPGADRALTALTARSAPPQGDGPTPEQRAAARTLVAAEAFDGVGRPLARAVVEGPSPYDLTAALLTWAAGQCATGQLAGTGAMGPADAFGGPGAPITARVDALIDGCASLGLARLPRDS